MNKLVGHWKLRGDCRGQPLRIGFGQTDYFRVKIADVRLYNGALTEAEIRQFGNHIFQGMV